MITKTQFYQSKSYDPWYNLAVEDYFFNTVEEGQCIFYLWQNQNTVVIGKNQNAWRECRSQLLEEEGGRLARRSTGGGAVFQDLGNMCFTFIVSAADYDLHRQLGVIVDAIKAFGLDAYFSGRNDVLLDGKKFSGNAFKHSQRAGVHHGTLLYNVDMSKLSRYLQPSKQKMEIKGIKSVVSRVTNLLEYAPDMTLESLQKALEGSFTKEYGQPEILTDGDLNPQMIQKMYQQYSSWDWRYGKTPAFDVSLENQFLWGAIDLGLQLSGGIVAKANVYSDAMDPVFIDNLTPAIEGSPYDAASIAQRIRSIPCQPETEQPRDELADWIQALSL